ncbi:hypothetical protein TNCV_4535491 [Trichonephila clavipes]|nr:hypothetical protein TNCV_4535491 [Trichonephila clavipes]
MDVCKLILPLQDGGTLNSRRAASPLVKLEEKWVAPTTPRVSSLRVGVEPSQIVLSAAWNSKLWLTTGVKLTFCRDEFRGPPSDIISQGALTRAMKMKA